MLCESTPETERLQWLEGELKTALAFIDQNAHKCRGGPEYVRGLKDMAEWILEITLNNIEYQNMRSFLGPALPNLPKDASRLVIRESE
jgi:hypothetical protein